MTDELEIRFADVDHFAQEVESNLRMGRALVRYGKPVKLHQTMQVSVCAPETDHKLSLSARVVFAQAGVLGLQLSDMDAKTKANLQQMVESARRPPELMEEAILPDGTGDLAEVGDLEADGSTVVQTRPRGIPSAADTVVGEAPMPIPRGATVLDPVPPECFDGTADRSDSATRPGVIVQASEEPTGDFQEAVVEPVEATSDPPLDPSELAASGAAEPAAAEPQEPQDSQDLDFREPSELRIPPPRTESVLPTEGLVLGPGNTIRLSDGGLLLAAYLTCLKTEQLVVEGQPSAASEDGFTVTIDVQGHQAHVDAIRLRQSGDFTVLGISDPTGLAELLPRLSETVLPLLEGTGLVTSTEDLEIEAEGPVVQRSGESLPAHQPEPQVAPPELPRLEGDWIRFKTRHDLRHEIETNVKNGGLFAQAPPLPIRTRKTLQVEVEGVRLSAELVADVVFADAGRVGFSFLDADGAYRMLSEALSRVESGDIPASSGETGTVDLRSQKPAPSLAGRIHAPLSIGKLLDLQNHRVSDPSNLAETTLLQLFEYMVATNWTGVLKVQSDGQSRRVWMHEGDMAFIEAKPFDEETSLGRILVAQKKVNETSLREALERSKGSSRLVGKMLVLLGIIKRAELVAALREQMRAKMDTAFNWSHGEYETGDWVDPPGDADLVVTKGLSVLARHCRSRFDSLNYSQLETLFGASLGRAVVHEDLDRWATPLQLQPKELRFLELSVDGRKTIHDAVMGSPIGRLGSLRLVSMCLALGALRFRDRSTRIRAAESTVASVPRDETLETLKDLLAVLSTQNHFEVLGVHWSSHHRTFREAWEKVRRKHDPRRPPLSKASREAKEVAAKVVRRVDQAYDALKDATSRTAYRKELFDQTERQYAAEMLVKQGQVAQMRGDRVSAIESLETAVELDPSQRNRALLTAAREGRR